MSNRQARIEFVLIVAVALGAVITLLLRADKLTTDKLTPGSVSDHTYYISLAMDGSAHCNVAPYCYRVLQPMMTRILPFDLQTNFLLITMASLWLTGIALYYLLKTYKFSIIACFAGVLLFYSLGWATGFLLFYFWMSDGLVFFLITLAIYCIRTKRDAYFMGLLAIGAVAKESILVVAPLYYTLNLVPNPRSLFRSLFDGKLAAKTLFLISPAIIVLLVLRFAIPVTNTVNYLEAIHYWAVAHSEHAVGSALIIAPNVRGWLVLTYIFDYIATFGLALFLPFLAIKRNIEHLLRYVPFLVLVSVQLLLAEATERLLVYAFPVVVLLALNGLSALSERLALNPISLLLLPLGWFGITLLGGDWMWTFLNFQAAVLLAYFGILLAIAAYKTRRGTSASYAAQPVHLRTRLDD